MPKGIYIKTEEHKRKLSESRLRRKEQLGYINSLETRRKLSIATKKVWQNPEYKIGMKNKKHNEKTKRKISELLKGIKRSEETKRKIGKASKGNKYAEGNKHTEKWKMKMSKGMQKENNPAWQGGISFEPYGEEFNYKLKELIRNRDNRICQLCNKNEKDNRRKLSVHHIDYNKKNCKKDNLISLCWDCNTKANGNRNYWINYFQN